MTSIPKDGQMYLCWVKNKGHAKVWWSEFRQRYNTDEDEDYFCGDCVQRWMDEKGVWHVIDP
jgi:hypothetical protein